MAEVGFEWPPYALQLDVQTAFTRTFGETQPNGSVVAYDWTGVTFELRFGTQRAVAGSPFLVLDSANGDITGGAGGAINFLFRPARINTLVPGTKYYCDLVQILGGVPMPFAKGIIIPYAGVRA